MPMTKPRYSIQVYFIVYLHALILVLLLSVVIGAVCQKIWGINFLWVYGILMIAGAIGTIDPVFRLIKRFETNPEYLKYQAQKSRAETQDKQFRNMVQFLQYSYRQRPRRPRKRPTRPPGPNDPRHPPG